MRLFLILSVLLAVSTPALAINKCELDGRISYSDKPCSDGKAVRFDAPADNQPMAPDAARARDQAMREKNELKRFEDERRQREAKEDKDRQKLARADETQRKKCADLALRQKWAEEDAAAARGKSTEKAKRDARRKAEIFQAECSN